MSRRNFGRSMLAGWWLNCGITSHSSRPSKSCAFCRRLNSNVRPFPLHYYAIKIAISAAVIVAVSEVAKRNSGVAALLAALPITSLLAFIWLHVEGSSSAAIGELSTQVFWLVLPSLVLFLVFPVLLKFGINFWLSLGVSCAATIVCYWIMAPFLRKAGVQL